MAYLRSNDRDLDLSTDGVPSIASISSHTMGASLFEYLRIKVHPDIAAQEWSKIIVTGKHCRAPISRIAAIEKTDKPFNWQRPTTVIHDSGTLELQVFPGHDYVEHYAAIVATYLDLHGRNPDVVRYWLPTHEECMRPLLESNLRDIGDVDIAVLGYVDAISAFLNTDWEGDTDQLFSWRILTMPNGTRIAFIGCRICYWGDIGGNVIRALQRLANIKCALYVGKLGSLDPTHIPNKHLATGGASNVRGSHVTWKNVLENAASDSPIVKTGVHICEPTVLRETKPWFEERKGRYDFVDPEIGQMGKASVEGGTEFGYLHVISDNLARKFSYDLSNERAKQVREDRKTLANEIQRVLGRFFEEWDAEKSEGLYRVDSGRGKTE